MKLFRHRRPLANLREQEIYAAYELVYTLVDFTAAVCFVVGSVMFFDDSLERAAIWAFLVGSICFALKPTLRLIREVHLLARGDIETVAKKHGP